MRAFGLPTPAVNIDYYAIDDLGRAEIFPIYPPIGESFGVQGSYTFSWRIIISPARSASSSRCPYYLSECYKVYRRCTPAQLAVRA